MSYPIFVQVLLRLFDDEKDVALREQMRAPLEGYIPKVMAIYEATGHELIRDQVFDSFGVTADQIPEAHNHIAGEQILMGSILFSQFRETFLLPQARPNEPPRTP